MSGKKPAPPVCPYCVRASVFRERSDCVYRRDFGPIWLCEPCRAWVGCHPGTAFPLGRLANDALRKAKVAAHAAFDPLWRRGPMGRSEAYRWLAGALGIKAKDCHIGMFDEDIGRRVVEICTARRKAA